MRKIDKIIIHCSATKAGKDFRRADIERWHKERRFPQAKVYGHCHFSARDCPCFDVRDYFPPEWCG